MSVCKSHKVKPKPYNTASIAENLFCKQCGWPVIHVCCNDEMSKSPYGTDWWGYCSNKGCKYHDGEEWPDLPPEFTFQASETLSLCEHSAPVKFGCFVCLGIQDLKNKGLLRDSKQETIQQCDNHEDNDDDLYVILPSNGVVGDTFEIKVLPGKKIIINKYPDSEYIRIKKALWDEMLQSQKNLTWCINEIKSLTKDVAFNRCQAEEKIENLENLMLELQTSINTHPKILEHDERINKLEDLTTILMLSRNH